MINFEKKFAQYTMEFERIMRSKKKRSIYKCENVLEWNLFFMPCSFDFAFFVYLVVV